MQANICQFDNSTNTSPYSAKCKIGACAHITDTEDYTGMLILASYKMSGSMTGMTIHYKGQT